MAMQLEISTSKAEAAIKQIEASITQLKSTLDRFPSSGGGFQAMLSTLSSFKGVDSAASASLINLGTAIKNLGNASTTINQLSSALARLSSANVDSAATAVQRLATSLASIRIPPGLAAMAAELGQIAKAANTANTAVSSLSKTMAGLKAPAGLSSTASQIQQVGTAARKVSRDVDDLGSSLNHTSSFIKGFGLSLGGLGLSKFVQDAFELRKELDQFNALVGGLNGPEEAAKTLEFLRAVAKETATDFRALVTSYGAWTVSAQNSGYSAQESGEMFLKLSKVFRSLGLDAEKSKGAFNAFVQMVQKGTIQMEELKGQLGDRGVPAVNALAKALGVTVDKLGDMAKAGQLGSEKITLLIDQLLKDFGGSLPAMLNSFAAQWTAFTNQVTYLQEVFGKPFFELFAIGLSQVNAMLAEPSVLRFASDLGTLLGAIASVTAALSGGLVYGFSLAADAVRGLVAAVLLLIGTTFGTLINIITAVGSAFMQFMSYINSYAIVPFQMLSDVIQAFMDVASTVGSAIYSYIIEPLTQIPGVAAGIEFLRFVFDAVGAAVQAAGQWFAWLADVMGKILGMIGRVIQSNNLLNASFKMSEFATRTFGKEMEQTSMSAEELLRTMNGAATGTKNFKSEVGDTSPLDRMKNTSREAANVFDEYKAAAERAADGQRSLNQAAREYSPPATGSGPSGPSGNVGGGTPGSDSSGWGQGKHIWDGWGKGWGQGENLWDAWSGGGLVDKGSRRKVRAPASAFIGAPHFAGGGTTNGLSPSVSGGGIPAILHSNEAVVPLTGGGAIPIEGAGGGGNYGGGASSQKFYDCLMEIKQKSDVTIDTINNVGGLIKTTLDLIHDDLTKMQTTLMSILQKVTPAPSSYSGGSGTGSGSNTGGSYASGPMGSVAGTWKHNRGGNYQMAYGGGGGVRTSIYDDGSWSNVMKMTQGDTSVLAGKGARAYLPGGTSMGSYNEPLTSAEGFGGAIKMARGYASGSPNASRDARGGFRATLHPDEAVIPLPDGRSVPVDLSNWRPENFDLPAMRATIENSGGERSNSASQRPINVVVTMNINTPDAGSFRRSEDQMMQELKAKLDRATKNIGSSSMVDDPTQRN